MNTAQMMKIHKGLTLCFSLSSGVSKNWGGKKNGFSAFIFPYHPWDWYIYLHLVVFNGKILW